MPTFICEKCGHIDNTACGGNYWSVQMMKHSKDKKKFFTDEYANTHLLCCVCTPTTYEDGSTNREAGKWHNIFKRRHWSEIGKEAILKLAALDQGDYVNAEEYFKNLKQTGGCSNENVRMQESRERL